MDQGVYLIICGCLLILLYAVRIAQRREIDPYGDGIFKLGLFVVVMGIELLWLPDHGAWWYLPFDGICILVLAGLVLVEAMRFRQRAPQRYWNLL
jgi:hypothetical protein